MCAGWRKSGEVASCWPAAMFVISHVCSNRLRVSSTLLPNTLNKVNTTLKDVLFILWFFVFKDHTLTSALPPLPSKALRTGSSLCIHLFAESLQSCPILCDPRDDSPPGSPVPGILQARTLEWVAISFSKIIHRYCQSWFVPTLLRIFCLSSYPFLLL